LLPLERGSKVKKARPFLAGLFYAVVQALEKQPFNVELTGAAWLYRAALALIVGALHFRSNVFTS
jgi:hypothetical protein